MHYNSNNRWSENFQILIDKIGFLMLFKTFFRTILAFLEAEIFTYKSEKYSPLITDLSQRFVTSFFSIEVSAQGQITKDNP